jgi:hypothetical protein
MLDDVCKVYNISMEDGPLNVGLNLASSSGEASMVLWNAELEVALLSPIGSPGVADFPEFWTLVLVVLSVLSITYDCHCMIDSGCFGMTAAAVCIPDNTGVVSH